MYKLISRMAIAAVVAGTMQVETAHACKRPRIACYATPVYVYPSSCTVTAYHEAPHVVAAAPAPAKAAVPKAETAKKPEVRTVADALKLARQSLSAGRREEAVQYYTTAIQLDADNVVAHKSRGIVHLSQRNFAQATSDLTKAASLAPQDAETHAYLAFIYGACPSKTFRDGKKAIEEATKACELTQWKNPEYIVALASAHAEAGDFEDAVKRTEQAIELADGGSKDGLRVVLAQFQRGQAIP